MAKFNELIQGATPVLVDFFAAWCGPCKTMPPVLDEVKKLFGDKLHILKIDVDLPANRQIAGSYQVQSVPTLLILKEGKVLWRQSGAIQVAPLTEVVKKYI